MKRSIACPWSSTSVVSSAVTRPQVSRADAAVISVLAWPGSGSLVQGAREAVENGADAAADPDPVRPPRFDP